MTFFLGTLNVAANTPTNFKVGQGGLSGIIIGNESPLTTIVSYDGTSYSKSLYPGTVDYFPVPSDSSAGNLIIKPSSLLSNASSWPSSFLQFDGVGANERINTGTYPITLQRWLGGGTVSASVTNSNQLFNQGNPDGSNVINITDSLGTTWSFDNNGIGTLSINIGGALAQVLKLSASDPLVTLGATGAHIVAILGRLQIEAKKINDSTDINLVDWSSAGVYLKGNPSTPGPAHYQSDGTNTDWIFSAVSTGSGVSVIGTANITHNLKVAGANATPDIVLINDTSGNMQWGITARSSTQFTISANAAHNFNFAALKFS